MTLKTKWIEILYNVVTGSRKIRNFFTPIGAFFYALLVFSFVVIALQVDRLLGISDNHRMKTNRASAVAPVLPLLRNVIPRKKQMVRIWDEPMQMTL